MKAGGHGSSDSRSARRTRDSLIVGEIALTLVLLSSAGLVLKSFAHVQALSLGFEPRGLLTARIDLPFTIYSDAEKIAPFTHALLRRSAPCRELKKRRWVQIRPSSAAGRLTF